jgi:hypothetical protein
MYRNTGASTPSACMSEGLAAYLRMARRISPADLDGAAYRQTLHDNLILQIQSLRPDGSFVRGIGRTDVRIDFIQHNISAFAGYSVLAAAEAGQSI